MDSNHRTLSRADLQSAKTDRKALISNEAVQHQPVISTHLQSDQTKSLTLHKDKTMLETVYVQLSEAQALQVQRLRGII